MKNPSINELTRLIEQGLEHVPFPYVKGNSVRIGNYVVRTSKRGNFVYNIKEKEQIAHTFSKTAAVAIAKKCAEGNKSIINEVMKLDLVEQDLQLLILVIQTIYTGLVLMLDKINQ